MSIRDWPIERKFLAATLVITLTALALVSVSLIVMEFRTVRAGRLANTKAFVGMIARNSAAALIYDDPQVAQQILSATSAEPSARAAALYDAQGKLYARFPTNFPASDLPSRVERGGVTYSSSRLDVFADVLNGDKYVGSAYLRMDLTAMRWRFRVYVLTVIGVALLAITLVVLLSRLIQRWITKPLLALSTTAQSVAQHGDYSLRAPKHGTDEVGRLVDSFNRMVGEAQTAQEKQKTYAADLQREVEQRTVQLRNSIQELEAFSYSVSHDMRSPLRAMQGYAQFLAEECKEKLSTVELGYLDRIRRASTRLDTLVQDILNYSRISREEIYLVPVNLDKLLDDVIAEYPHLRDAKIEVQRPLGIVRAHEAALTQVLSNLMTNGLKFMRNGEPPILNISSENKGHRIRVFVRDNGIGVAEKDLERIFRIFERIHSTAEYEGTGIGLSIVKKAVEKMGGQIGVTSKVGVGSTFWFELERAI